MAELRILWDAPIDALSVGLLGAGVLLVFARLKDFEWGGFSGSLADEELAEASRQVEAAEPPAPVVVPPPPQVLPAPDAAQAAPPASMPVEAEGQDQVTFRERAHLLEVPTNPTERVLWAVEQIRIELIVLAGNSGNLPERLEWHRYRSLEVAKRLLEREMIPPELWRALSLVTTRRNELVHGGLTRAALTRVDTLALELLQKLRAVPRQYIRVLDPDPPLYSDAALTTEYPGTKAVMLASLDDQGRRIHPSVFPRLVEYQRGAFTSWEWTYNRAFDEPAWYRDPATGDPKQAWSESLTYAGREYPVEWGLEHQFSRPDAGLD